MLWITRHGQTHANEKGIVQGSQNSALNSYGVSQMLTVAERLSNEQIKTIITSSLFRTIESGLVVKKHPSFSFVPLYQCQALSERNLGLLEGLPKKVIMYNWPQVYVQDGSVNPRVALGIEAEWVFRFRIESIFMALVKKSFKDPSLVIAHKGVLHALLASSLGNLVVSVEAAGCPDNCLYQLTTGG